MHQELLAQREFGLDVVDVVIRTELRKLGRRVGGILEPAEMIHQTDALRVDARPDAALRDFIHFLDALLAAFGDAPQEGVLDGALQDLPPGRLQRAVQAHGSRERRGAESVHFDAELLRIHRVECMLGGDPIDLERARALGIIDGESGSAIGSLVAN